jgi:XTP/dITP diphosphohydrolase
VSAAAGRPRLRLASANAHKLTELRRLLQGVLGSAADLVEIADLTTLDAHRSPPEVGTDYAANALLKLAAAAALAAGEAVIADDSGLEVDVLAGAPGVHANRWATGPAGEALNGRDLNAALLARLEGVPDAWRGASMVSEVRLWLPAGSSGRTVRGRGAVRGRIAHEARGSGGFGYDAVFLLLDGRRLSEVPAAVKDQLGHRGQAMRAVAADLLGWIAGHGPGAV